MASVQIPANTPWLELATSSPTSGSTVSFTSLAEYNDYRIEWFGLTGSASNQFRIRFNNDSGTTYASHITNGSNNSTAASSIVISSPASQAQLEIAGANGASKRIIGFTGTLGVINAMWNNTGKINQIDILTDSGTFTAGTIKIFGRS